MIRKFNILQNNIINYQIIYPNAKTYYQKIEINININNKELYIFLLNKFPILRSIINLKEKTYIIDETIDLNKITIINNLNHKDFIFDYNKYLVAILYRNNFKIIIFHHLFIDGTSENLIYESIININLKIDDNKYYDYQFNYPINNNNNETSLICDYKEINNFVKNKGALLDIKLDITENELKEICNKLKISSHTYFVGVLAFVVKVYSDNNNVIIYDMFSGRDEKYKNTIGFFSFVSEINILMNNITIDEYFQSLYTNIKKNIRIYSSSNNINIIINDVRKLSIFKKSKITQQNGIDITNQLSLKIIDYNHILFKYNTNFFNESTIKKIINLYQYLFKKIMTLNTLTKLFDLEIITDKDKIQVLKWGIGEKIDIPELTIQELFKQQVKKMPNNIALIHENKSISYKELDQKSDILMNILINKYNVQNNQFIFVYMKKNINLIISIIAILKCGCTYVPIDENNSEERIKIILNDINSDLLLTNFDNYIKIKNKINLNNINWEYNLINNNIRKNNIVYVLYTSGTTGKPKGVIINQKNLINVVYHAINYYEIKHTSRIFQFSSIGFDIFAKEIFPYLLSGASIYIYDNNFKNINYQINKCTHLSTTPNILNSLEYSNSLKVVSSGGSKCTKEIINKWSKNCKFINSYGPTECTIYSICTTLNDNNKIVIGKPIYNTNCYIIKNNSITPIGIIGEIWIGGIGVSDGYINNEKLTNEKFIKFNGERVYKTGDYGKWTENGEIEFHDRIDNQIKINGIRIELGEIETVIKNIIEIDNCVVIFEKNKLYCFTSPKTNINIKDKLLTKLPKYMIPSFYYSLEKIPLNLNGKIDKSELLLILNKYEIDNSIEYKIITNDILEYINCDFALIKNIYDSFTDKNQKCLYINTNENIQLFELFNKLALNLNPYWIIQISDNTINNLPEPKDKDTYRNLFINTYINTKNKNINLDIYNIICENLKVSQINENITLENYGIDSLQFIQLDAILSKKYNIEINNNDNYNDIILKLNNNSISYCSFHKNPNKDNVNKLLVLFKGLANNFPTLLIEKKNK